MTDAPQHTSTPVDIAIFGGGIAGLWLANLLTQRGYSCVLLERDTLGGQQTLLSQGILHGGLKYALGGALSHESEAIAGMPDRWRASLAGEGDLDLRGVRVLSDTQHLWSAGSLASRFTTFFASRMLRGRIQKLKFNQYPSALHDKAFRGNVYRLDDLVLDTESLVRELAAPIQDRCLHIDPESTTLHWCADGLARIDLPGLSLTPTRTLLAAGNGNAALLAEAGEHDLATDIRAQARPLQMVLVQHRMPHRLYAHCIGASNKPRLTVTTHEQPDGALVWYLGGDLAERGVEMTEDALIRAARAELADLFPWLDFSDAELATVRIDRAEPHQTALVKPDNAYAEARGRLLVTWPTKLTLTPDLGDRVLALLARDQATPAHPQPVLPASLPRAQPGRPVWYRLFGHEA